MAGIGGFFKGVKAAFSKNHAGKTGLYKNSAGQVKAKPGYELAKGQKGGGTTPKDGFGNKLARNPGKTALAGGAVLGAGALYLGSGSSSETASGSSGSSSGYSSGYGSGGYSGGYY